MIYTAAPTAEAIPRELGNGTHKEECAKPNPSLTGLGSGQYGKQQSSQEEKEH